MQEGPAGAGPTALADAARFVQERFVGGRPGGARAVVARVVELQGFGTWPGDDLVVVDGTGRQHGRLLGGPGSVELRDAATALLAAGADRTATLSLEVHGAAVAEAGLSCGGRAELLLRPVDRMPLGLWSRLATRAPVALVTTLTADGTGAPPVLVAPGAGEVEDPVRPGVAEALDLLGQGRSATVRLAEGPGELLVEVWVPEPRLVVVGAGEVVSSLRAQAGLLGWEVRALDDGPGAGGRSTVDWPELDEALAWGGASSALVVLSHDPHADVPAMEAALDRGVAYIGAMGSRRTQSRRMERLRASGRTDGDLARIRRPIGLDLGGRTAAQLALSICAEILARHCGRGGGSLSARDTPIHGGGGPAL